MKRSKPVFLCDLAIEKTVCDILDDIYEDGINKKFQKDKETEDKINFITDIVVESVIDELMDETSSDIASKKAAVQHLFSEASCSDLVTPPGTPPNVIVL